MCLRMLKSKAFAVCTDRVASVILICEETGPSGFSVFRQTPFRAGDGNPTKPGLHWPETRVLGHLDSYDECQLLLCILVFHRVRPTVSRSLHCPYLALASWLLCDVWLSSPEDMEVCRSNAVGFDIECPVTIGYIYKYKYIESGTSCHII